MDSTAYRDSLSALLPMGLPWPREPEAVLSRLLHAWAEALARVDARALDLLEEADPRCTTELLPDWERAYGLPDPCLSETAQTRAQRLAALLDRITDPGRQRPADFIAIAAALGVSATLTEYQPERDGDDDDQSIRGPAWAYTWELRCAADAAPAFESVLDDDDTPLSTWIGVPALECLVRRLKPAHTTLIMSYAPEEPASEPADPPLLGVMSVDPVAFGEPPWDDYPATMDLETVYYGDIPASFGLSIRTYRYNFAADLWDDPATQSLSITVEPGDLIHTIPLPVLYDPVYADYWTTPPSADDLVIIIAVWLTDSDSPPPAPNGEVPGWSSPFNLHWSV